MSNAALRLRIVADWWRKAMAWDSDVPLQVLTIVDWELVAMAQQIIGGSDGGQTY